MGAVQGERTEAWMEGVTLERDRGGWSGSDLERELTGLAHVGGRTGQVLGAIEVPVKMPGRQFGRWAGTLGFLSPGGKIKHPRETLLYEALAWGVGPFSR